MNAPAPSIRLLVCGSADRGDDGAAMHAVAHLLPRLDPDLSQRLEVRRCPQLDAVDLIDVAPGEARVVLAPEVGDEAGEVVVNPLDEHDTRQGIAPRSSHALPIDQVLGITQAIRGAVPAGTFVGNGGKWFGYGQLQSRALRKGMPEFERAAEEAILRLAHPVAI
jgi:Ni,Fe-hydrogenase maturation factor